MNEQEKRYELETIDDIFNAVNSENVGNFIEGFSASLRAYVGIVSIARVVMELAGKAHGEKKNTQIVSRAKVTYLDDGKQENVVALRKSPEPPKENASVRVHIEPAQ